MRMNLDIVWVHFGDKIPKYLVNNLKRARAIFPDLDLNLITDCKNLADIPDGVLVSRPIESVEMQRINEALGHPKNFRSNFWFHAIARFLVLDQFVQKTNRPLIHFESDILIAKDFPFGVFNNEIKKIAFPVVSRERAIASVVFLPNSDASRALSKFALEEVLRNPQTSDMLILRAFYDSHPEMCQELPICSSNLVNFKCEASDKFFVRSESAFKSFKGIIDGNDFGVYFFGSDPRNARGRIYFGREVELNLIHTSRFKIRYNDAREFVDAVDDSGEVTRLFSLHLTSKSPEAFSVSRGASYLRKACERTNYPNEKLLWRIVITQVLKALLRRIKILSRES